MRAAKRGKRSHIKKIAFATAFMMALSLAVPAPYGVYAMEENNSGNEVTETGIGETEDQTPVNDGESDSSQTPDNEQGLADVQNQENDQEADGSQAADDSQELQDVQ